MVGICFWLLAAAAARRCCSGTAAAGGSFSFFFHSRFSFTLFQLSFLDQLLSTLFNFTHSPLRFFASSSSSRQQQQQQTPNKMASQKRPFDLDVNNTAAVKKIKLGQDGVEVEEAVADECDWDADTESENETDMQFKNNNTKAKSKAKKSKAKSDGESKAKKSKPKSDGETKAKKTKAKKSTANSEANSEANSKAKSDSASDCASDGEQKSKKPKKSTKSEKSEKSENDAGNKKGRRRRVLPPGVKPCLTAYQLFCKQFRPATPTTLIEHSRQCGAAWKALVDKSEFLGLAETDRARFVREMMEAGVTVDKKK